MRIYPSEKVKILFPILRQCAGKISRPSSISLLYRNWHNMTEETTAKYNVIFVLGGPGAGKGTQCDRIKNEFGYVHLSAGDLLRIERNDPNSEYGEKIDTFIKEGSIVPVEITCNLLQREMEQKKLEEKENFLIDGFPRNEDNLKGWNKQMSAVVNLKRVLFIDCPEDVCVQRCLNRGKTSGRTDDNAESLKKRIQTYKECTMPVIEHYEKLDLVSKINGEKSPDEVFEDVKNILTNL